MGSFYLVNLILAIVVIFMGSFYLVNLILAIVVIFMGSFYLVNLILAIVAMSYDDCQKQELEEEKAEAMVTYLHSK